MQDALVVRGGKARAELARDLDRLVLGKPPDPPQERGEVFAVDVLHGEEVPPVDLADVVDAADVGMRDAARVTHLGVEALDEGGLRGEFLRQEFQRDRLAELQIVGAVDLAHAAVADQPDDAVPVGQDRPGRKSAAIERGRGGEASDRTVRGTASHRRLRDRRRRQTRRKLRLGSRGRAAGRTEATRFRQLGRARGAAHVRDLKPGADATSGAHQERRNCACTTT